MYPETQNNTFSHGVLNRTQLVSLNLSKSITEKLLANLVNEVLLTPFLKYTDKTIKKK